MKALASLIAGIAVLGSAALASAADTGAALDMNQPDYESIKKINVAKPDGIWIQPFIEVESDGTVYTKAKTAVAHYALVGEAEVSKNRWRIADIAWGVGSRFAGPTLGGQNFAFGHFYHSTKQSVGKTKHFKQQLPLDVPVQASGLGDYATARCNATRKGLEAQGVSRLAIFHQDRDITISVSLHFAARGAWRKDEILEASSPGMDSNPYWRIDTKWFELPVRCLRAPDRPLVVKTDPTPIPLGPQRFKEVVGATQATLIMVPGHKTGQCPLPMTASAVITTNGPTVVKYRLESDKGELSPVRSVAVDQTRTAFFTIDLTLGKAPGAAGPSFTAGHPSGGALGFAAAPAPAGVFKGFYRLRIVAPNQLVSQPASYEVKCLPLAGHGFSATGPSTPQAGAPVLLKAPAALTTR